MSGFSIPPDSPIRRARPSIPRGRLPDLLRRRVPPGLRPGVVLPTRGPAITDADPSAGPPGTVVTLTGARFQARAQDNEVQVGGDRALVLESSPTRLVVLTGPDTRTGPIAVKVGGRTAVAPGPFTVTSPARGEGPPVVFEGRGTGADAGAPTSGTLRVLVSLVRPSDRTVSDPTAARNAVIAQWADVTTFYDQASYGDLTVQVDVTSSWAELSGTEADYVDSSPSVNNIDPDVLPRFVAEAAQAAVDDGMDLDDYDVMAGTIFLDGGFIRAWGNWSQSNFSYPDGGINLTADHAIALIAIQETANWGRCAHELGHALVDAPSFSGDDTSALGEDVYGSDLVDSGAATADVFEMMGRHDDHPLFTGYNMQQLGWYDAGNIAEIQWDRNPSSQTFDLVAHGTAQNTNAARFHVLRINVATGLSYFVQVRQQPSTSSSQIFDPSIPTAGAADDGGVVVTTVLSETVNNNQQMRFITLLHDQQVLAEGQSATDPARALTITVEDVLQARPMVCRVRVEWAQSLSPDPSGRFDLNIEPWDSGYQTPDIWVDRQPYGSFDKSTDSEGRPQGNGDKPRPGEINKFFSRVHNDGTDAASDVKVTFYTVEPPGVGDNGNWAPIHTETVSSVAANSFSDVAANWVPVVGRHTCLKVFLGEQLGEVAYGNNHAQENVFEFEAPAASVPDAVTTPLAVRNPLDTEAVILLSLVGVPEGWAAGLSHAWLRLGPRAERTIRLHAVPLLDYGRYLKGDEFPREAHIRVIGHLPQSYQREGQVSSHMLPIGGVTAIVRPKRRAEIRVTGKPEGSDALVVTGTVMPDGEGEIVRVDTHAPDGLTEYVNATTTTGGHFQAVVPTRGLTGRFRVIARTVSSPNVAEAESAPAFVDIGGGTSRPEVTWPPPGGFGGIVTRGGGSPTLGGGSPTRGGG